ncbi:unnamed protein product [Urochloa humidicola]
MASSGNSGAAARKHLRVLLPFSCDSQRIPEELAGEIGAGEARIVGPSASGGKFKVRCVEVRGTAAARCCGAGGRSSRPLAASPQVAPSSSATTAAACSPSRCSTPAAASEGSAALRPQAKQLQAAKMLPGNCSSFVCFHQIPWKRCQYLLSLCNISSPKST